MRDKSNSILFNPDSSAWETLSPRQPLTSVPFAIEAAYADTAGDADTLDGMDSGDFAGVGHGHDAGDITSGTFSDARIPDSITRDTELADELAGKSDVGHNHDDRYYTKAHVNNLENRISALEATVNGRWGT